VEHQPTDAVEYFSGEAEEFHASYREDANRLERMRVWRGFLDRYATGASSALDFGCGTGILACELARRGIDTVGIDGSEQMLEIGRTTARSEGLTNVRFEQRRLPLPADSGLPAVELVISSSVLEYLESVDTALKNFHDLLAPDGTLIFSLSNRDSLSRKLVRVVHRLTGKPVYFGMIVSMVTADEIRDRVERAGLRFVETSYFGGADRLNRLLRPFVGTRRASNMLIVAARRL